MEQEKIGKFIAETRKAGGFTQRELAERLGITDKAVSKWERGMGMPDVSLMLPLCEALHISVNELLSGERLSEAAYKQKAEENIMSLMEEAKKHRRMVIWASVKFIPAVLVFTLAVLLADKYRAVLAPVDRLLLVAAGVIVMVEGIVLLLHRERTIGHYQCPHCGAQFVPGPLQADFACNLLLKKRLKCPDCGKKSFCQKV